MTKPRKLTMTQYLSLLGLCQLMKDNCRESKRLAKAAAALVGVKDVVGDCYYGHVSDACYEDDPAAYIISRVDLQLPDNA